MKLNLTNITSLSLIFAAAITTSCTDGRNARQGTAIGAVGGAAAGGIIGHQSGNTVEGALIGGGLGALGGNLIGGEKDEHHRH